MLLYSKLHELLQDRFGCKILQLFGKNDALRYIKFQTKTGTQALLFIPSKYQIQCDVSKLTPLTSWKKEEMNFDTILSDNSDLSHIKEIKDHGSAEGFIDLLNRLAPSLVSVKYKVAIISSEFLSVLRKDGDIDTFNIQGGKEVQLLIVVELEDILVKNISPEIDRVNFQLINLIDESYEKYFKSLLILLQKCQELKIVTEGKKKFGELNSIETNIFLHTSHNALKIALDCLEKK